LLTQRDQADAVVCGAQTVRSESVPIPHHAPLVVISSTGNLRDHRVTESSYRPGGVIVLTGSAATYNPSEFFPDNVVEHHVLSSGPTIAPHDVVSTLAQRSYHHLLVEGGKTLASAFARAGLLDEVCLSLTGPPLSENHPPLPWWDASWSEWTAQHVLTDDLKTLYFRYRVLR
jgi:riboflavin biosynthesis pyrimidine reductase